jgi:hypothetical protein
VTLQVWAGTACIGLGLTLHQWPALRAGLGRVRGRVEVAR